MKSSFTVTYKDAQHIHNIVLGVTSIMPNLNGLLLQTEDGHGIQIESWQMACGIQLYVEYNELSEDDINPDYDFIIIDRRSK